MKVFLICLLALTLVSGTFNRLGTGKSCTSTTYFVVTNFDVNPYPPTAGQVMQISMTGTFSKTYYVSDIRKAVKLNGGSYVYSYSDYAQNCLYGQLYTFNTTLTAGTQAGLYTNVVAVEEKQNSPLNCWEFTYHI